MTFVGFFTRRLLKKGAYHLIDNVVEDETAARRLKLVAGIGISVVGVAISIGTLDLAGLFDGGADTVGMVGDLMDAGTMTGSFIETAGTAADHFSIASDIFTTASTVTDHASTMSDVGDIFGTASTITDHVSTAGSMMADTTSPWLDYASASHDIALDHGADMASAGHHALSYGSDMTSTAQPVTSYHLNFSGNHPLAASVGAVPGMPDWLTKLNSERQGQVLDYYLPHLSPDVAKVIKQLPIHEALPKAEEFMSHAIKVAARITFGSDQPYTG